jgi:sialidase-1
MLPLPPLLPLLLLLLTPTYGAQHSQHGPPSPSPPLPLLPGVAFVTRVFEGGTGGCVMYRTPSLLNVGNGVLLAFTQCRQVGRGDASPEELHLKKSEDSGRTWGPATVLPFAADPLHNSLHRAQTVWDSSSNAVFLFDDALPYPTTKHNETNGGCIVRIWKSSDLGQHWTSVQNMTSDSGKGSGLATGIQLPSGKLVVSQRAGCNSHKSDAGAHALWSVDGGRSWTAGSPTAADVNENQIARLTNGSLLMNARTTGRNRLSLLSTNEGQSWSAPQVVAGLSGNATCEGSLFSFAPGGLHGGAAAAAPAAAAGGRGGGGGGGGGGAAASDASLLFFSHPQAANRSHLTIRVSRDDGNTWSQGDGNDDELLVHAGGSAYSCLGSTSEGELAVLWEADGKDLAFATTKHFNAAL